MTRLLHSFLRPFLVLCALVALLSLAGCSGGGDDSPTDVQQVIMEAHETIDAAAGGPSRQLVGNRQVCVINQQYYDELRPHSREVANTLTSLLTLHGYDVTWVDGTSATVAYDYMRVQVLD